MATSASSEESSRLNDDMSEPDIPGVPPVDIVDSKPVESGPLEESSRRKRGSLTSSVWNEFIVIEVQGKQKGKCKGCGIEYAYSGTGGGTSNMKKHLNRCPAKTRRDVGQMILFQKSDEMSTRGRKMVQAKLLLRSEDEDMTSPDEKQVLKRPKKVSEAPTQVGLGSSNGIVGDDFSEALNNGDPIQTVGTNQVDNVSGLLFDELKGESEFHRTGGREGLINIGNFPVQEKFAALYRQIWQRHGHLATRSVIKTSTCILVVAVSELLESITELATVKSAEVDSPLLDKWEGKIKDAEELKFNVGWLRKHFDELRKHFDAASSLRNSREIREKALKSALQRQITVCARYDALKDELEKTEQELEQVTLEVFQHEQDVSEDLAAWSQYMSSFQKSILRDAI